jgi:predicted phosphoadenosine phosphosulfate sulfurtransferase
LSNFVFHSVGIRNYAFKTQFKEWFDRYKYVELAATSVLLGSQFSRIFSGLTTAYLITFAEYFAFTA